MLIRFDALGSEHLAQHFRRIAPGRKLETEPQPIALDAHVDVLRPDDQVAPRSRGVLCERFELLVAEPELAKDGTFEL
jgi:hypothetical protein